MSINRLSRFSSLRRRVALQCSETGAARSLPSRRESSTFRNLWLAATISDFGFYVTVLALPLTAAITLDATPFQMGLLTAAESIPYVLFGLLAGVVVDRLPRRTLLIATDWLRASLLSIIPVLALIDGLSFAVLVAVALGVGLCSLIFHVAQASIIPAIVAREELAGANGRLEASGAAAQATGPGLAGLLIGALSAPIAITVNALSFAISGMILRRIPPGEQESDRIVRRSPVASDLPKEARNPLSSRLRATTGEIVDGLRILFSQSLLRASLLASSTINLFGYVFLAVYILFMARTLDLSEFTIGLILSSGGVGAVLGAVVSPPLRRRFGFGPTMVWAMLVCGTASVLIPVAFVFPSAAIPLLAAAELLQYGALAIFNIGGRTLRQVFAADQYQGRVNATARTLTSTGTLIGSLSGGLLGSWIGLGNTLIAGAIGMMLAIPIVLLSPLSALRELPVDEREPDPGSASVAQPEPVPAIGRAEGQRN